MTDRSDSFFQDLTEGVLSIAGDYVRGGGVQVSVKTNLGPEIPIAAPGDGQGGSPIADLVGLQAAVIVRNRDGEVITAYGDPPATDPVRAAAVALIVGGLVFVLVRGLRR